MELFQQIIHSTWENLVSYSIRVHQIFPCVCPGKTEAGQNRRWAKNIFVAYIWATSKDQAIKNLWYSVHSVNYFVILWGRSSDSTWKVLCCLNTMCFLCLLQSPKLQLLYHLGITFFTERKLSPLERWRPGRRYVAFAMWHNFCKSRNLCFCTVFKLWTIWKLIVQYCSYQWCYV